MNDPANRSRPVRTRFGALALAVLVGIVLGTVFSPGARRLLSSARSNQPVATASSAAGKPSPDAPNDAGKEAASNPGLVQISPAQIEAAGISLAPAASGVLTRRITLPGVVIANADRLAAVPAKVAGTIYAVRRRPGDLVAAGEVLAVIESREVAEAKGEYLTALRSEQLERNIYDRERTLWEHRVSAEQDYLRARNTADAAAIRLRLARQRLAALGLSSQEIDATPKQPAEALRLRDIRAPIAGRVTERLVNVGSSVVAETRAFTVADLSTVWMEMAAPPADLPFVRSGATVEATASGDARGQGRIIFVSPQLDPDTRSARVTAELPNPAGLWSPGSFATASVATDEIRAPVIVPHDAIQTEGDKPIVFVRAAAGFERRSIVLGRSDDHATEVTSGLKAGETIAVANSFILKAELGKGDAEQEN